jgi:hypothetical protein
MGKYGAFMKTKKAKASFIGGAGVVGLESGLTPKESLPMGNYYGTGHKNPMGRLRGSTVGYRPVSRKQLGTPPTSVV